MSIDHGKLLALADDIENRGDKWAADKLRAIAQPAEAVEGEACDDCDSGWQWFEGYGREHRVKCEACGGTGKKPAEAAQSATINSPETFTTSIDAAQGAVAPFAYGADLTPGDYDMEHSVWLLRPGESVPAGCTPLYTHQQAAPAQGDGVSLIAAERRRQIDTEGWTTEHDDEHAAGELARAAGCYALAYALHQLGESREAVPAPWPWDHEWWKPTWDARQLVKAGALIAAEIDRLQRAAAPSPEVRADPGIEVGGTQHGPAPSQEGES